MDYEFALVILDLDGTIYPGDGPLGRLIDDRTTSFLLARSGLDVVQLRTLEAEVPSILEALDRLALPRRDWAEAVYRDLPYAELLSAESAVRAALKRVRSRRVVVTLSPPVHAEAVLQTLGITDLIDEVSSIFSTSSASKADTYAKLVAAHASSASHVLVVGDNEQLDLAPAAALGCHCALITQRQNGQQYPACSSLTDVLHLFGFR